MNRRNKRGRRRRIGTADWTIVHRWKDFPGRGSGNTKSACAGAVNYDRKVMYLRQYRRDPWQRLSTIVHECIHAGYRVIDEQWVERVSRDIATVIGDYFEIRDRQFQEKAARPRKRQRRRTV